MLSFLQGRDEGTGRLNFNPTPETPSLQFVESVSPGSAAAISGLQSGDYLLEVKHSLSTPAVNPLTPTVAIWVQLKSILCQTGLSRLL